MTFEQAKEIISHEHAKNELKIIEFHGGEPLLNFELIRDICEWFWKEYPNSKTDFFLTTNGTLFTEENKKWFEANHTRIVCALSLDGSPEMNFINRGCVINEDTLSFMKKLWPRQNIKMTISLDTLPRISEGVIYAHQHNFRVSANLAYGVDWTKNKVNIYEQELQKLVDFYIANPDIEPCSIFKGEKLIRVLMPYSLKRHCQAGQSFHAFDIDGKKYPCHVFAGNTLKAEKWESISDIDFMDDSLFDDTECKTCEIHNVCPTCFGMNFIERGEVYRRDKAMCEYIKAEITATCKLYKHRILSKNFDDITEKEYLILKAIETLSQTLDIDN